MAKSIEQTTGPYWTKNWIEAMWRFTVENFVEFDTGNVDFEALGREEYEFRKALFYRNFKNSPRAKEAFNEVKESYKSHVESGKQGGRPRKETLDSPNDNASEQKRAGADSVLLRGGSHSNAPARTSGPMPANVQKVYDFAALEGLDKDDAYECWYVTTAERDGNDADGNPVTNWKAFVRTWCNTRSKKRSA